MGAAAADAEWAQPEPSARAGRVATIGFAAVAGLAPQRPHAPRVPSRAAPPRFATAAEALHTVFGYDSFRGEQAEIIDQVVGGGDAVVLMPTGGGKSLCYQIPRLLREGTGVVVSPLIALMHDQVDALVRNGVRAAYLNSSQQPSERAAVERAYLAGELDLLYIAPERLNSEPVKRFLEGGTRRPLRHRRGALRRRSGATTSGPTTSPSPSSPSAGPTCRASRSPPPRPRRRIARSRRASRSRAPGTSSRASTGPNIQYRIAPKLEVRKQLLDFVRSEGVDASGTPVSGIVYALSRASTEKTRRVPRRATA